MTDELAQTGTKKMGRPTVRTEDLAKKLEDVLRLGASDSAAITYAGIARETFYSWVRDDEEFSDRMDRARNYALLAARQNVVRSIIEDKDVEMSKWYIEKHDIKPEGNTQQTQVNVFNVLKDKYTMKTETHTNGVTNGHANGVTGKVIDTTEEDHERTS